MLSWTWLAVELSGLTLVPEAAQQQVCVGLTAACVSSSCSIRSWSLSLRSLLLAALCISVAVVWGVYRNEDRLVWRQHHCPTSAESDGTEGSGLHGNSMYLQRFR